MSLKVRQGFKPLSHSEIPLEEDWDIDLLVRLCSRFLTDFCYETGVFNPRRIGEFATDLWAGDRACFIARFVTGDRSFCYEICRGRSLILLRDLWLAIASFITRFVAGDRSFYCEICDGRSHLLFAARAIVHMDADLRASQARKRLASYMQAEF